MAVERMRDGKRGDAPKRGDTRKRAIIAFAIWETVGFVPFILALVWLNLAGPERAGDEAMYLSAIAAVAFAIYVGILFFMIVFPVIRGSGNAR